MADDIARWCTARRSRRARASLAIASSAPRKGLPRALDALLNVLEILLGAIEQFVALAPAFRGESAPGKAGLSISGRSRSSKNDNGKGPSSGEFLDRRGAQRGDQVEPGRLEVFFDARIGDHPAVADHHDTLKTEALLELGNLIAEGRRIAGVAFEHLDRDRTLGPKVPSHSASSNRRHAS